MTDNNEMLTRALKTVARANQQVPVKRTEIPPYIDHATLHALCTVRNRPESSFKTLIDCGAASGAWGKHLDRETGNDLQILFIEPNRGDWEKDMESWAGFDTKRHHVVWQAAWEMNNEEVVMVLPSGSRSIGEVWKEANAEHSFTVTTARVDTKIAELQLPGPYFLKMDVHGSEIPVLVGCSGILAEITGIHVECNFYNITPTARRTTDLFHTIERLGFRLAYLGNLNHTRFGLTWEVDALFLRPNHPIFEEILGFHREQQAFEI